MKCIYILFKQQYKLVKIENYFANKKKVIRSLLSQQEVTLTLYSFLR